MSQYKKDRIKETIIKILLVCSLVFLFGLFIVCGFIENEKVQKILFFLAFALPVLMFFLSALISKTIKTYKKSPKKISYIEYSVSNAIDIKEKFAKFGVIKKSRYRECDYYVSFTVKADLISKNIVTLAYIEVDSNYTQQEYKQFIKSIPELRRSSREKVYEDYTNYENEIFVVLFYKKEDNAFVDDYISRQFLQWRRVHVVSVYDEQTSTVRHLKDTWLHNRTAKKYLSKIFSFTENPQIIIKNKSTHK